MVGWGTSLLPLLALIVGPTEFIANDIINVIGLMIQNFLQMGLFVDPLDNGEFIRSWMVFYWLWWISYTSSMTMFITHISRGRKIEGAIWALILGSTVGRRSFFGVMKNYPIHQFANGATSVPQVMATSGGGTAIQ